ncbi:MAG: squalene--hopene cyclase [Verrucomicrobia bacterium]|nr:squalene--hopene cyclase [Verrucomicrobiota bacterium]
MNPGAQAAAQSHNPSLKGSRRDGASEQSSADARPSDFQSRLQATLKQAIDKLLLARGPGGHWVGDLSGSALSTAVAVCALSIVSRQSPEDEAKNRRLIDGGLTWLAGHINPDGGWGDTDRSLSNLSTTALGWAAFGSVPGADEKFRTVVAQAEGWLKKTVGSLEPSSLVPAIEKRYGKDRTFSVPILMMCTLAGRLGGAEGWRWVKSLPFELAALPRRWFGALQLPVVSYALPALIAIGQVRHHHHPTRNPLIRLVRDRARKRTLNALTHLQPGNGGFLEATPLTGFVTMSLAAMGQINHPVARKGIQFLSRSMRRDGSWPIDTNLATWVTTLSVKALGQQANQLSAGEQKKIRDWLLAQQFQYKHPYTDAAPGGWAWTDLPGGVPDADDTAGVLLALHRLGEADAAVRSAAVAGVTWLLNLQNRDGGIPTFCRGWGALPFDRSSPDLTAHAVRAWLVWLNQLPDETQKRTHAAIDSAVKYLGKSQRADGSWSPLWFGNQQLPHDENPTYGTSRVLMALQELAASNRTIPFDATTKGAQWLLKAQNQDGGWGGGAGVSSSVEETALAVETLCGFLNLPQLNLTIPVEQVRCAVVSGVDWLIERVDSGQWLNASPIGFYFAKLWYYERLYPMIFTVAALNRVAAAFGQTQGCEPPR